MTTATTNIELYQRLNTELMSMVEQFTNLVKGTKEGLEADEQAQRGGGWGERPDSARNQQQGLAGAAADGSQAQQQQPQGPLGVRDRRVPGELLEVLVEKLLAAGHQCVHTVSELKKGAVIGDFDTLIANIQQVQQELQEDAYGITRGLTHIRREAEGLLARLEQHYYSSAHKGQQPAQQADPAAATLAELCAQAQALIDDMQPQ